MYELDVARQAGADAELKCLRQYHISPPGDAYAEEFVVSPQGDRIAWMFDFSNLKGEYAELWVSRLDGTQMHPIGFLKVPIVNDTRITAEKFPMQVGWLPDGKRLSYMYKGALYTVPVN